MIRKIVLPLALAAGLLTAGSAAEARDGCGLGFHRGFYGWCRPNLGYRPYAYGPVYRHFGYRRWGGPRWHYGYRYGWHRRFGWHGGWHRRFAWHGGGASLGRLSACRLASSLVTRPPQRRGHHVPAASHALGNPAGDRA